MSGEIELGKDRFQPGPDGYWDMLSRFSDGVIRFDGSDATERRWRQLALALDEIQRLRGERALADQLANALFTVQHDRPSAHSDHIWAMMNHALEAYEEARREQ